MYARTSVVQHGRAELPTPPGARFAHVVLAALIMALSATSRADDTAPAVTPPQAGAVVSVPQARVRRPPTHHTVAQGIDETVQRMSRGLDLDAEQQAKLREILLDQYRQARKLMSEGSAPGSDRVATTVAMVERTKTRIRALLNEAQRAKYSTDVPRDQTAPAQADLQHWMQVQESNQQPGAGVSK